MSVPMLAPVSLFVFRRPALTAAVLEALRANEEAKHTDLFVFSDAAKREEDLTGVEAVRRLVREVRGFRRVVLKERLANFGLARSITEGVSEVCEEHGRTIVLEDDLEPSRHFLRYMNDALDFYADEERVASVHAYCYPVSETLPETFFMRGGDCWGWGTWRRAWKLYQPDGRRLLQSLEAQQLTHAFDMGGAYPYTRMLRDQIAGKNDSWAIRWHASLFLANRLTLYPGSSQIQNLGADGSGEHVRRTSVFEHRHWGNRVDVSPIALEESLVAREAFARFLRRITPPFPVRVLSRIRRLAARGAS
jgi:hypothetical protein